jgi:hypothetical protein
VGGRKKGLAKETGREGARGERKMEEEEEEEEGRTCNSAFFLALSSSSFFLTRSGSKKWYGNELVNEEGESMNGQ